MSETIQVFIGTHEADWVPARVLAHSILSRTQRDVQIHYLEPEDTRAGHGTSNRARTRFSFSRFEIPEKMGYQGKAIYLDSDMLVFSDIGQLWDHPMEQAKVLCSFASKRPDGWSERHRFQKGRQTSVLLLDCSKLDWKIEKIMDRLQAGEFSYEQLMGSLCITPANEVADTIPFEWNSLEYYEEGVTRLLHYTVGHRQPWISNGHLLEELWLTALKNSLKAGALSREVLIKAVSQGYVKPSLLAKTATENQTQSVMPSLQYFLNRSRRAINKRIFCN